MIDPFLLLAPILLLPIVGLLRFTGCAAILDVDDVTYAPQLEVKTTGRLPDGQVGVPYSSVRFEATGGIGPLTWKKTAPAELTLDPQTGVLDGIPIDEFDGFLNVEVTDSPNPNQPPATASLRLIIVPGLTITTRSLPDGKLGKPYLPTQLTATGGHGTLTWSVIPLPNGLVLTQPTQPSESGLISGVPAEVFDQPHVIIQVRNEGAITFVEKRLPLTITS